MVQATSHACCSYFVLYLVVQRCRKFIFFPTNACVLLPYRGNLVICSSSTTGSPQVPKFPCTVSKDFKCIAKVFEVRNSRVFEQVSKLHGQGSSRLSEHVLKLTMVPSNKPDLCQIFRNILGLGLDQQIIATSRAPNRSGVATSGCHRLRRPAVSPKPDA